MYASGRAGVGYKGANYHPSAASGIDELKSNNKVIYHSCLRLHNVLFLIFLYKIYSYF